MLYFADNWIHVRRFYKTRKGKPSRIRHTHIPFCLLRYLQPIKSSITNKRWAHDTFMYKLGGVIKTRSLGWNRFKKRAQQYKILR